MKKIIFICFFFIGCAKYNQNEVRSDIDIRLTNTSIKDSTDLKITLTNNSLKNYYLLYNSKSVNDIMKEFNNGESLYTISAVLVNNENSSPDITLHDGSCPLDVHVHTTEDIVKLKPKQKVKLSIPFRMKTKVSTYCYYGYKTDMMVPNKQYYVYMRYSIINEYFKNALPKTVKDSIEQMGYELYDKQIVSNRVPLVLKK